MANKPTFGPNFDPFDRAAKKNFKKSGFVSD